MTAYMQNYGPNGYPSKRKESFDAKSFLNPIVIKWGGFFINP